MSCGWRTFEERGVVVAGDREALDDRVEQLPDDLLRVRTASRGWMSAGRVDLDYKEEEGVPKVIGTCSGELQGATTSVESLKCSSGISFRRWNFAALCTMGVWLSAYGVTISETSEP